MPKKEKKKIPYYWWRRLAQAAFLLLFLFLFRKTDYAGSDEIQYAVNIFFRWDPLVAASAMLAAKAIISLLLPAIVVVGLSIVLGRFFCGWVCPMGTLLDMSHKIIPPRASGPGGKYLAIKYYLLGFILVSALFGLPVVGFFDPFSILIRGMTLAIDPAFKMAVTWPFDFLYQNAPDWVTAVSEPIYSVLKDNVLPYNQAAFTMSLLSFFILMALFALERIERRFWCRNLCPLGAMLALFSRFSILHRHPWSTCKNCTVCSDICRMGAINDEGKISPEACNLCLDCLEECPRQIISINFKKAKGKPAPLGVSRRGFVGTVAAGVMLPAFFSARAKRPNPYLIRPPGALEEKEFLNRCVRCGECMKVCINNALHPAFLDAGVEGMFTPVLISRIGYCELNCTLCGQVCPSGAIEELTEEKKVETVIGRAWFDKDRCLPFAKGTGCIVCEEMCPVKDKAIKLREAVVLDQAGVEITVLQPYIIDHLCVGCGICENKCPLPGEAAVKVISEGESRDPENEYILGGYGY